MRRQAVVSLLVVCLCTVPVFAKVTCVNTSQVGTFAGFTTTEPGDPPQLTFIAAGSGSDSDICLSDPDLCTTLPCYMTGCINLPYNTQNCLSYLVAQCGTAAPVIRYVGFVSAGACP